MTDDDLCYKSAAEVLELFGTRELSPVELLTALIERAERVEPVLNAFSDTYYEQALAAAGESEARYAAGTARPLDGVPVVAKTNTDCAVAGTVSSNGCLWQTGNVEQRSSPAMQRLQDAGVVVHARTTMPELGWAWTSDTRAHGVTRNPWNPRYTSGGSSSGSAVAVAAGTTTIATGTDCLGSLRHPTAMCGTVGLKPPYGRNPLHPWMSMDFFKHIGPMARTVADLVLMQNVMSGPYPRDHASVPQRLEIGLPLPDVRGLRFAFSMDMGYFPVTPDVARETRAAVEALRAAGATVTEIKVDWAKPLYEVAARLVDRMYGDQFTSAVSEHPDEVCDYTAYYAKEAEDVTSADVRRGLEAAGWGWNDHLGPLFEIYDGLLLPTLAFHHVPAENRPWEENIEVGGQRYTDHDAVMTGLFNLFSRCPVLAVPTGFTDEGMPTSLQLAGRPFDEVPIFRAAAALEEARPWLDTPARRPVIESAFPAATRA